VPDLKALPAAAREAIRARLEGRPPRPPRITAEPAAVFVTLRHGGELRGCMGTLEPCCEDLVRETMERAVVAAFEDPRFPPLDRRELDGCEIEVTVLGALEPARVDELDPARYGVEVRAGDRRAVLLPAIPGIDTVEKQLAAAMRKAGIAPGTPVTVRRFRATKVVEGEGPGEP